MTFSAAVIFRWTPFSFTAPAVIIIITKQCPVLVTGASVVGLQKAITGSGVFLSLYLCVWAGCLSGCQQTKTKQEVTFCCCFIWNKRIGGDGGGAICIHPQGPKVLPSTLLIARWALPPVIQPVSQLSCIASHFTYYYFAHQVCVNILLLLLCAAVCGSNHLLALHLQSSRSNAIAILILRIETPAIFKQNHFQWKIYRYCKQLLFPSSALLCSALIDQSGGTWREKCNGRGKRN